MRHGRALIACLLIAGLAFDAAGVAADRARARAGGDDIDDEEEADARAPVIWVYDGDGDDDRYRDDDDDRYRDDDDDDDDDDRYRDDDDDDDDRYRDDDRPRGASRLTRRARGRARGPKPWQLTIGPYLWAASVDADVSLGSSRVSAGGDFMDLQRNARYGAAALAEARYRRFAAYGDVMYGVVGLGGAREVGPLMVVLDGTATSLMVDAAAGYQVAGGPGAALTLEARLGVRYQRTAIAGAVTVGGAGVANPRYVDAAADALVGGQVVARPLGRLRLVGTFDLGVYGASTVTWSATAEAGVRLGAHVLATVGWRTLTTQRPDVSIVMHGPRAAVQLTF